MRGTTVTPWNHLCARWSTPCVRRRFPMRSSRAQSPGPSNSRRRPRSAWRLRDPLDDRGSLPRGAGPFWPRVRRRCLPRLSSGTIRPTPFWPTWSTRWQNRRGCTLPARAPTIPTWKCGIPPRRGSLPCVKKKDDCVVTYVNVPQETIEVYERAKEGTPYLARLPMQRDQKERFASQDANVPGVVLRQPSQSVSRWIVRSRPLHEGGRARG